MPARVVPLITGQYYHIFNRGVNKQPIFLGLRDYQRVIGTVNYYLYNPQVRFSKFLLLPKELKSELWDSLIKENDKYAQVISFCFMLNHFHILLKQTKENGISKLMANFQNSYVRYFNTKHNRIGPIFQGQFKALRIEDDNQLIHLSRYIHLNPFTSFVIKEIKDLVKYQWSSYPDYLGKREVIRSDKKIVLDNFKSIEEYEKFVVDQADYQRELEKIKHLTIE